MEAIKHVFQFRSGQLGGASTLGDCAGQANVGGIVSILVHRWKGARFAEDQGVPIAAGLIVGSALAQVLHAVVKVTDAVSG